MGAYNPDVVVIQIGPYMHSHLVDCKSITMLLSHRLWNCKPVGRCVLFLVHMVDSACFNFLAVTCSSSSLHNKE